MFSFLRRSFFQKIVTLFFISIISFLIIHLAPGTPTEVSPLNPKFTKEDVERLRRALDLDKPLHIQYLLFYKKLFTGELKSYKDNRPVLKKIGERFLNSLPLFIVGTVLTWFLAFPLGIKASLKRGTSFDRSVTFFSYFLIALPSFFLAYLLIIFVVKKFNVPVIGLMTFGREDVSLLYRINDRIWHLVLPSVLGATGGIAILSRYVRAQMLEIINQDYVRTAKAKGLPDDIVYYKHALRNALLPFATMFGLILPGLIGGSVIVEYIFAWPGMGRLGYEAILARDYPVIISLNFIAAVLTLIGTFISDLLYMIVDPRIRL
ncbi:MAG TPA: ABC transporter permease [Candidatus Omnitrophica bacterium]|nr:ABC transporter permease [Candidatus Omnitrophota bacterium]